MMLTLTATKRRVIYAATCIATPVVVYAKAKGWIGDLEMTLWAAEVTAVTGLAGIKVTDE